jgi:hydroxymethylpyrimidine pyrophosphatase-like HAD family hydrolase
MSASERMMTDTLGGPARSACPSGEHVQSPLPQSFLETELGFYRSYHWCLNAFPTVKEVRDHLRRELSNLEEVREKWQRDEVITNLFILSCALANAVDDYMAPECYDFSKATALIPPLQPVVRRVEWLLAVGHRQRRVWLRALRIWREAWGFAVDSFLMASLALARPDPAALAGACASLAALLDKELPAGLLATRIRVPAAFRTQDLTHHDILDLADRFAAAFPDRERPLLVAGLRTAGSYFAPLVRASLAVRGYRVLEAIALRPKAIAPWEQAVLARCAKQAGLAVVVDEPADTGSTLARMVHALRRAGVPRGDIVALLPVHPTRRDWNSGYESLPLSGTRVLTLEPEHWHKEKLLEEASVERRLQTYFRARGYAGATLVASANADHFNRELERQSEEKFHTRLKRVYEVSLLGRDGSSETRYVLAKSVGWGWLGYHAFLAAEALAEFVPPVLGLRDGILYTEWLPQTNWSTLPQDREGLLRRAASYVAARVRSLRLDRDPGPQLDRRHQKGAELLAGALSGAYGWKPAAALKRARLRHELLRQACPVPTLIDGKMRLQEWIQSPAAFLKTDFEHHGLGKTELNVVDPAYDLAETILHLGLSPAEEQSLLETYREASGDHDVGERLFMNKLLAGTAAVKAALANLKDPRLSERHEEFNRSYINALDFLTTHTARFCAGLCERPETVVWHSPLVVMDIDGVLDKQIFGFPSTTAAGIRALSLLHAHGFALALNTARTLAEVQEYCRTYGCAGGVAEYGSVVWDAVERRTRVLVSPESRAELQRVATALRSMPGVFLNERYEYSLRAFAYEGGRTVPLPTGFVQGVLARCNVKRITVHQTYLDTTILACEVDKGKGLQAMLELVGRAELETIAIGDSEPDLAMFCVAGRSFAPAHIGGRSVARLLGCRIANRSYQPGLLGAVRSIIHPNGGRCARCRPHESPAARGLLWDLLNTADRRPMSSLLRAMADPIALEAFLP